MERGRYRVLEPLGQGGAGVVYRAADGEAEVALRVLRDAAPVAQARFAREARLAAEIESRHLVRILDVGDDWFAMPLYPRSLRSEVPLSIEATVKLAAQ